MSSPSPHAKAQEQEGFSIALLSDAHLMDDAINPMFGRQLDRTIGTLKSLQHAADFAVFGGNLWHMGGNQNLVRGAQRLQQLAMPIHMVPGDHDWYPDLGAQWRRLFGPPHYSFHHKGVHVVVLMNRHMPHAMSLNAHERMAAIATLHYREDQHFEVGTEQLQWLRQDLAGLAHHTPVVVFSHGPLFDHHRPWRFATGDGAQVHALLRPFRQVTYVHGHCQRPLIAQVQGRNSFGMASTAWSWPKPPDAQATAKQLAHAWPDEPLGCAQLRVHPGGHSTMHYYDLAGTARVSC